MKQLTKILLAFLAPIFTFGQLSVAVDSSQDSVDFADVVDLNYKINVPDRVDLTSLDFSALLSTENIAYEYDTINFDEYMSIDVVDGGVFKISNNNLIVTKQNGQDIPREGTIKVRVSSIGAFLAPKPKLGHLSDEVELPLARKPIIVKPRQVVDLNGIRDIIKEEKSWLDWGKWLLAALGIIGLLAGISYFMSKRKNNALKEPEVLAPEIKLPAHEIALADLQNLEQKQLWQNGKEKEYHSELTRIVRQYIEDRYDIAALEMTTSQLNRAMNSAGIDNSIIGRTAEILQIADKVKFAKGKTGPEINESFLQEAYQIVRNTMKTSNAEEIE